MKNRYICPFFYPGKEIPDLIEGDIFLSEQMKEELKNAGSQVSKRNAQRSRNYLWSGSTVPYEIDSSLTGTFTSIDSINKEKTGRKIKQYKVEKSGKQSEKR